MKKKILSIALALCMVLTMMPMATGVAWADPATSVTVGGVQMVSGETTTTYYKNEGTSASTSEPEGGYNAKYEPSTGTLTLNGLNLTSGSGHLIYATGDITIKLEGENTLGNNSYGACAINVSGNLTISGSGELEARNAANAMTTIYASGSITINNSAKVTATKAGGSAQAINAEGGDIVITNSATVVATNNGSNTESHALLAGKIQGTTTLYNINVSGGATLIAAASTSAVNGNVSIDTNNSTVRAGTSADNATQWSSESGSTLNTYKYLKIEPKATVETALEDRIFSYAYDVQRSVSYPAKDATIRLSGLEGPIIDSNTNHGTSAGSWTLTKAGTYSYMKSSGKATINLEDIVEGVANQYTSLNPDTIVVHELKNQNDHISYGVVVAYNAAAGYALFQGDILGGSGAGYFLSTSEKSGEFDVTASAIATDFVQNMSISLSQTEPYTFPAATVGYTSLPSATVTITNTGNAATGALTVSLSGDDAASFTLEKNSDSSNTINISSITKDGYDTFTVAPKNGLAAGTYTATVTVSGQNIVSKSFEVSFTVNAPSNPGSYVPTIQKPTVITDDGAEGTLSFYGDKLTIKVTDDYELADVILNGVSKGKVTELTGLKTGDKVEVKTEKKQEEPKEPTKEEIVAALKEQQLVARSKLTTSKSGRKAVLITWYDKNGNEVTFDGVEIYRSTKRDSGYGDEPIFVSKTGKYYNTAITEGTRYYYKVRGYVIIDGQKYYTDYSLKAIRTIK